MARSYFPRGSGADAIFDLATGAELARMSLNEGAQMALMAWSASGATTADSGESVTASYSGIDLQGVPARGFISFSLTSGTNGAAVMIANANGLGKIADVTGASGMGSNSGVSRTTGALHLVFGESQANIGYWPAGASVPADTILTYNRTLTKDGSTKYRAGFVLTSGGITIYLPDGSAHAITSANYYAQAGRYVQIESYTDQAAGGRATFYAATFSR